MTTIIILRFVKSKLTSRLFELWNNCVSFKNFTVKTYNNSDKLKYFTSFFSQPLDYKDR